MGCPFRSNQVSRFWRRIIRKFFPYKQSDLLSPQNCQAILDTTVDSIVTINEDSIILAFNKNAEKTFGYSRNEVIGKNVNILMPEPYYSQHSTYVQNYLTTGQKKIIGIGREAVAKKKDGTIFPIDLAVSEVITDSNRLFTGIIRDITIKKKEEETLKLNTKLEAELKAKNEYVSIIGHELRTQLSSIYGSLRLLLNEQNLSDKMRELVSITLRSSERLNGIVNDVLDIERIRSGKLLVPKEPIELVAAIKEAIATVQPFAKQMEVTIIEENPYSQVLIFGDYNRILRVMINFLTNAMKFSPPQGKVFITVTEEKDIVRVSVHDQGKGIPKEFHEKIFTPFFQVPDSGARIVGGIGLGLYICKNIINQLGGKIGFTSKPGEGTTFYFELPIYKK